ncbi:MAG TPA: hypothetical protein RMH85_15960 [Polyangiaceae bacterium LLY-WYZ-15_(1-7)]|nr:hypothetical protein [Myxococcales bacterium]MAT29852.1 hypothetical protein [Sandaracinus sp.]HJK91204.1 hypothetical protein [Polyangiaceae bacterium LLY-WYZ-15_(1-7)]MBJ71057.1 hypothetical protein [Sandaracinus sp.]HJL01145.1 hypothetical protein [Polyangiaceae bacterium LLY-WYZ-15_(1-7)]
MVDSTPAPRPPWPRRALALALLSASLVALGGCPGDLQDADRFPSTPLPECVGDIDVEREIFEMRCGTDSCHAGDEPAAELNLVDAPDVFAELMNVDATQCDGRVRVDPDDVLNSFLLDKIRGPGAIPPGCGDQMPFLSRLNGNEIACVQRWIQVNLEGHDGGVPMGDDAGPGEDAGPEEDAGTPMEDAGPEPVDCSPIDDAPNWRLCQSSADSCEGIFDDGPDSTCADVCGAAGLVCTASYADVPGECAFNEAEPFGCEDRGNMADYCICERP